MPTFDWVFPGSCFQGQAFADVTVGTLQLVPQTTTLISFSGTVTAQAPADASLYYQRLEWRNQNGSHLFEQAYAFGSRGQTVTWYTGLPLGAYYFAWLVQCDSPTGSLECVTGRAIGSVGCEGASPSLGIRGNTWASYYDDSGREWALQVDSDSVFDQARGFSPVGVVTPPPLPRQWRPRRVRGRDAAGRTYYARIGRTDAQLWTGAASSFNVETSDRGFITVQVDGKDGEFRVQVQN